MLGRSGPSHGPGHGAPLARAATKRHLCAPADARWPARALGRARRRPFRSLRLRLLKLLLQEKENHAARVLVGYFLKSLDQAEHLQIFDAVRHREKPYLKNTKSDRAIM